MTNGEVEVLRNIIKRLKKPNCGCCNDLHVKELVAQLNAQSIEAVSRPYLDTWVIPALEALLPGDNRDVQLARDLSRSP